MNLKIEENGTSKFDSLFRHLSKHQCSLRRILFSRTRSMVPSHRSMDQNRSNGAFGTRLHRDRPASIASTDVAELCATLANRNPPSNIGLHVKIN